MLVAALLQPRRPRIEPLDHLARLGLRVAGECPCGSTSQSMQAPWITIWISAADSARSGVSGSRSTMAARTSWLRSRARAFVQAGIVDVAPGEQQVAGKAFARTHAADQVAQHGPERDQALLLGAAARNSRAPPGSSAPGF